MTETIKAGVIGWPISHSRSPLIHGAWLEKNGIPGSYEIIAIAPEDLESELRRLSAEGYAGVNVTIPHKEAALALADETDAAAEAIGAANTLVFQKGKILASNTDAFGFSEHLKSMESDWQGKRALVIGAGGAARAVLFGLRQMGVTHVDLVNRTTAKAETLSKTLASPNMTIDVLAQGDVDGAIAKCDLLVNTTSLGMEGQPALEFSLQSLPTSALVYDLVYVPLETELLKQARRRGNPTLDGLGMLLHQARPGFEAWFGAKVDVTPQLRDLIVQDLQKDN